MDHKGIGDHSYYQEETTIFFPRLVRKSNDGYRRTWIIISSALLLTFIIFTGKFLRIGDSGENKVYDSLVLDDVSALPTKILDVDLPKASNTNTSCSFFDCFNVYKCGSRGNKLQVYVYPLRTFLDSSGKSVAGQMSRQFYEILHAIVSSKFYTSNPLEACIFVPSIDMLNQNKLKLHQVSQALNSLEFWNNGENHLIFNMIPGSVPEYHTVIEASLGKAMIAGAGSSSLTHRTGFDISIPVYSSLMMDSRKSTFHSRTWLVVLSQININEAFEHDFIELQATHPNDVLLVGPCLQYNPMNNSIRCSGQNVYKYTDILQSATFCLVVRGARLGQSILLEAMAAGCIPVVIADSLVMPFSGFIDWVRAAVFIPETQILTIVQTLKKISQKRVIEMQKNCLWLWEKYFRSMEKITMMTLEVIEDRVFPHLSRDYTYWNPQLESNHISPLFVPVTAPKIRGFTAVILTYDRLDLLFSLIGQLAKVPSLSKILIIWNNQHKDPPHPSKWPKVTKPLKVIQTKENKLSNRFYPYDEIETEAILSLDDDIVMLTVDELEFAYEVWREFPDRIVGFPSRTHTLDNKTNYWKYESEWTNRISMVLTGAAFHHKFWTYMYTTAMPGDIKSWVDDHMNCEDIAMNFLIANITGKAPIKVTPKKKFRCPECTNTEMLSADLTHMVERTQCINRFSDIYGTMPLRSVEFRADPVLFKDHFPDKLKRFKEIGSL
ncbi:exostosin-2 [Venturia canescens]|uniref:exostosin-2 n=1 Tax=Venturia canescens TaxID=32260 RepID=UPI001C9C5C55|nr:exostosin-2 [Venturia canescens]